MLAISAAIACSNDKAGFIYRSALTAPFGPLSFTFGICALKGGQLNSKKSVERATCALTHFLGAARQDKGGESRTTINTTKGRFIDAEKEWDLLLSSTPNNR